MSWKVTFRIVSPWGDTFESVDGCQIKISMMYAKEQDTGRKVLILPSSVHCHEQGGSYDLVTIKVYDKETLEELEHKGKLYVTEVK